MEVQIKGKFYLRSDDKNYILSEKQIVQEGKKKGEEYWDDHGYYTSLANLLQAYKELFLRRLSITSFTELLKAIQGIDTTIKQIGLVGSIRRDND